MEWSGVTRAIGGENVCERCEGARSRGSARSVERTFESLAAGGFAADGAGTVTGLGAAAGGFGAAGGAAAGAADAEVGPAADEDDAGAGRGGGALGATAAEGPAAASIAPRLISSSSLILCYEVSGDECEAAC